MMKKLFKKKIEDVNRISVKGCVRLRHFKQGNSGTPEHNAYVIVEQGVCMSLAVLWMKSRITSIEYNPGEKSDLVFYDESERATGLFGTFSLQVQRVLQYAMIEQSSQSESFFSYSFKEQKALLENIGGRSFHMKHIVTDAPTANLGKEVVRQLQHYEYAFAVISVSNSRMNKNNPTHVLAFHKVNENNYLMFDGNIGEYEASSASALNDWCDTLVKWEKRPGNKNKSYNKPYLLLMPVCQIVGINRVHTYTYPFDE